ncbi:MAG: S-methyl-5-thioribose-1-phosphate isomerase [Phycisphaeraceae bacterium]
MLGVKNIEWIGNAATGHLRLLDQTRLPGEQAYLDCRTVQDVWDAIKRLSVRGAPAIGIAAAYGCVIAVQHASDERAALKEAADHLNTSRPTAVNLYWALQRMQRVTPCTADALLADARRIHEEDAAMCRKIGEHALTLIERTKGKADGPGILTHCNAGALATGGIGTATAGMYLAREKNLPLRVFADETRPLLQGSRLTAYELAEAGIDVTLICDDMAAHVMHEGKVNLVITGADRIAANGDAANKIGTYNLAVLARHHGIPFYVAAPSSTFDMAIDSGAQIPIEQRGEEEITEGFGMRTAPPRIKTYSPAFDVTPAELIDAIVTERGIIEPVNAQRIGEVLGDAVSA